MAEHQDDSDGQAELLAAEGRARAREQVFALLSHEIRTPLNGVMGMSGLLAATPLDATQQAYLSTLRECAEHLLHLVNDVLDLAKLEAGRIELEQVETSVEHLLQTVCELLSPRAYGAGIEIGWAVDAAAPGRIVADDGRLRQVLFNLAGNAVKLTRSGGALILAEPAAAPAAAPGRTRLRFTVRDTGPGLAASDQARVFQDFVQAEAGERAGGAGLGLAIVKRLAEALGAELGVDSAPGQGAAFWLEADFAPCAEPPPAALAGLRVGVQSPSAIVAEAAARQLAASGAVVARAGEPCDVRLLDLAGAPAPPARTDPPTLVMLAAEERERIEALRDQGFAGYLIKPLRRASLAERILAVRPAASGPPAETGAAEVGDERARPRAAPRGLRVLLAEDNPVNALLARALLARHGCLVDQAGDGAQAVAAALAQRFDLILMDMRMPGLDGLQAARAIRAAGVATPIVALTANAFEGDRRACREAGMDGFLSKPLDAAALEAALAAVRPVAPPAAEAPPAA